MFADYPLLVPTIGAELGDCVVANVGIRGDRELISVGTSANQAAKALGPHHALVLGPSLWGALPKDWQSSFEKIGSSYRLDLCHAENLEVVIRDCGIDWSVEKSASQMLSTRESLPLESIHSEVAKEKIGPLTLGPKHFKTCGAASIFVDIDGYSALIESLLSDKEKLGRAMQLLHLFRYELRQVTESDSDGIVIQHQGDRLQALLHTPSNDPAKVGRRAVEMCISLNSSVEEALNREPGLPSKLHVAIGCAFGPTVVVRFGVRGDLDVGCLGHAPAQAETLQLNSGGNEIRISADLYKNISDDSIRQHFSEDTALGCFVAEGLNLDEGRRFARDQSVCSSFISGFSHAIARVTVREQAVRRTGTPTVKAD